MTPIETPRLRIFPLTVPQLEKLMAGMPDLEAELGLNPSGQELDAHTREAMRSLAGIARKTPDSFPWITNWQIVAKAENIAVGSACFMSKPDDAGMIEIGYGIHPVFQHRGFMTEALGAIAAWAFRFPGGPRMMTAETEPDNPASRRVLEKCGFLACGERHFILVAAKEPLPAGAALAALHWSGNREEADKLSRFFQTAPGEYGEGDRFLGIRNPQTRKLARAFRDLALPELRKLLKNPWHEVRLCALLILVERARKADAGEQEKILAVYLAHAGRYINNWDLVDLSAPGIPGEYALKHGTDILDKLAAGTVLWEQRIAVVSTLTLIRNGEFDMTFRLVKRFLSHPHDLMHKACGWMLREVGKRDRDALTGFLNAFRQDMPRTMLRYAIEHYPEAERRAFLKR